MASSNARLRNGLVLAEVNDSGNEFIDNGNTMSFRKEVATTTATPVIGDLATDTGWLRRSLEEPVDRLMAAPLSEETETAAPTATPGLARSVHNARRIRHARLDT